MGLQQSIPDRLIKAQAMIDEARAAFERGNKPAPAAAKPVKQPPSKSVDELHVSMAVAVEAKAKKARAERDKLAAKIKPYAGDLSARQLGEKFDASPGLVRKAAREHGINIKVRPGRRGGPSPEQLKELRRYASEGGTTADAAKWLGVPHGTAKHWALKHEIKFGVKR